MGRFLFYFALSLPLLYGMRMHALDTSSCVWCSAMESLHTGCPHKASGAFGGMRRLPSPRLMYRALAYAETGATKPGEGFTRTRVRSSGSTAYGPAQLTMRMCVDFRARYPEELAPFRNLLDTVMLPAYRRMLRCGNMEGKIPDYDPAYDYGGSGPELTPLRKREIERMQQVVMELAWREVLEAHPEATPAEATMLLVRRWRGVPPERDPAYFMKASRYLRSADPSLWTTGRDGDNSK